MIENADGAGQNLFALRGQAQAAAGADEQRDVEMAFQLLDLPADGALGQAQLLRSLGEAGAAGDFNQRLQGLQRGHVANFIHAFSEWLDDFITLVGQARTL